MNKEFMLELADRIEQLGLGRAIDGLDGFNMQHFAAEETFDFCGTTGCIAGSAVALAIEKGLVHVDILGADHRGLAQELLGLTDRQAWSMFYARWMPEGETHEFDAWGDRTAYKATPAQAATFLREVAEGKQRLDRGVWRPVGGENL